MDNWVKLLEDTKEKLYEYNWNAQTQELCLGVLDTALSIPFYADASSSLHVILSLLRLLGADSDIRFLIRMRELECKFVRMSENCTDPVSNQEDTSFLEELDDNIDRSSASRIYRERVDIVNRYKIRHKKNGDKIYYIETITEYSDGTKETERKYFDNDDDEENIPLYNNISKKLIEGDRGEELDEV